MTNGGVVPQAPAMSHIINAEEAGDVKQTHQNQIADAQREVLVHMDARNKVNNKIAGVREKMPEYQKVEELLGELEVARHNLKESEQGNSALNDLKDERSAATYALKTAKYELSQLLVAFIARYQQRSVALNYQPHEISVKASIGKELEKEQQVLPL